MDKHTDATYIGARTDHGVYTTTPWGIANIHTCIIGVLRFIRQEFCTLVLSLLLS